MDSNPMEWFKFAFEGAPFRTYACLNMLAFAAHRYSGISTRYGWAWVAALGAVAGGWSAYNEALMMAGLVPSVLYNSAFTGAILGAGAATFVGIPFAVGISAVWPQSEQKQYAEALRDPFNPTSPTDGTVVPPPAPK